MGKQKDMGVKIQDSLRPISYIRKHIDEVIICSETTELLDLLEKQLIKIKKLRTAVTKNRTEKGKHFEFRNTYYRHIV